MLGYMVSHTMRRYWARMDFTIQEGLAELSSISSEVVKIGRKKISMVPKPRPTAEELLKAIGVELPKCIVNLGTKVATKKKLPQSRQMSK